MEEKQRVANIIVAKCSHTKNLFGIRVENKNGVWHFTWAFKIGEQAAKNEGYDSNTISGTVETDSEYPGCPHCETKNWISCGKCGKVTCYSGGEISTCAWCGNTGKLKEATYFDLKGGDY